MSGQPSRQIQSSSSNPSNILGSPSTSNPVEKNRSLSTSSGSGPSVQKTSSGGKVCDVRQSSSTMSSRPRPKSSPKSFQVKESHSKSRLNHLFIQINKEFEGVLAENSARKLPGRFLDQF